MVRDIHLMVREVLLEEKDLQAALDTIKNGVSDVVNRLQAQASTIADLKAQIAAGTPVSQEQLDGLTTEANAIADALTAAKG